MIIYELKDKKSGWINELLRKLDEIGESEFVTSERCKGYEDMFIKITESDGGQFVRQYKEDIFDFSSNAEENYTEYEILSLIFKEIKGHLNYINPLDWDMNYNEYNVSLHNYDNEFFKVFARCEQDALDTVVDYLEKKGMTGYFVESDEIENEDEVVFAGNHGWAILIEHLYIKELRAAV